MAAREQSKPMTIVLYDKLLQAVRPIVFLVGPRGRQSGEAYMGLWPCLAHYDAQTLQLIFHSITKTEKPNLLGEPKERYGPYASQLSDVVDGVPISSDLTC